MIRGTTPLPEFDISFDTSSSFKGGGVNANTE